MGELDRLGKPQGAIFEDAKMEDALPGAEGTVVFLMFFSTPPEKLTCPLKNGCWKTILFPFKFLRWRLFKGTCYFFGWV